MNTKNSSTADVDRDVSNEIPSDKGFVSVLPVACTNKTDLRNFTEGIALIYCTVTVGEIELKEKSGFVFLDSKAICY